jgi:very-short-patch-repair endonuclease
MSDQNSTLRRLCQYYLACIAHDDAGGVSVVARNGADPEFVELPRIELDCAMLPGWNEQLASFVNGKRNRETGTLRLGYPVFSAAGRAEGTTRRLMPLFLIDVAYDAQGLEPEWHTCALNLEALRELEGNGIQFAQHSMLELEEGLGLSAANDEVKAFPTIVERLKLLRPDWPWADPDPEGQPVKPLTVAAPGLIYERGIILRVLRPYTQGLELELQKLANTPEHILHGTALGALLFGAEAAPDVTADTTSLLEVLPMNPEQRAAVRMALNEPLSVITGPPGTGKSQVVANLLVNSAWRRRPVLFTSKNNKAVDVVDGRVNSLGRKPVMVRLGAKEHRYKLAEHLAFLVNGTVLPEELENLRAERATYLRLGEELAHVEEAERMALELNTQVRQLAEELQELGVRSDARIRATALRLDANMGRDHLFAARDALLAALPENQPAWRQLTWRFWRGWRVRAFERALESLREAMGAFAIPDSQEPESMPEDEPDEWKQFLVRCARTLAAIERLHAYQSGLVGLREVDFSELAQRRNELQTALVETSGRLWQSWIAAQPALLSPDQRLMLSRYSAVLKSVMEAGDANMLPMEVRREYDRITLDAPDVVSCFAVTALSVRNRVPFTPGYFDLVVFDESSQCDIASALPILFRARRAVIIGDNNQLQHISSLRRDRDAGFLVDQKLEKTHIDWQYSTQSLFELVASRVGEDSKIALRDHHRSHPDVIGYSNEAFYNESLRIVTQLPRLKRSQAGGPAVRWLDVRGRASRGASGSVFNADEVKATVEEVKRLVSEGYEGTIGVVTPFNYQADRIRRELERDLKLWEKLRRDHDFQSTTAHGFQGDERDLMLFSIVAGEGLHEGAIRFLEDEANVFNVAITRARAELVVVGDMSWCLDAPVTHLRNFAHYASGLTTKRQEDAQQTQSVARKLLSAEELSLLTALESEGLSPQARVQIEQYRVDMTLTLGEAKLAIDVEERTCEGDWGAEALEREQLKRQRLLHLGWDVVRFWPAQVRDDLPWCVARIKHWVQQKAGGV